MNKIAAQELSEAVWVVHDQAAATEVVKMLNDPLEGDPRTEKTYSKNPPPENYRINQPGFTGMYTIRSLRNRLDELGTGE